jgi:cell wall-associated NlpC family hydrolase
MNKLFSNILSDVKGHAFKKFKEVKSDVKDSILEKSHGLAKVLPSAYGKSDTRRYLAKMLGEAEWARRTQANKDKEAKTEKGREKEARVKSQETMDTGFSKMIKQQRFTNEKLDKLIKVIKKISLNGGGGLGTEIAGEAIGHGLGGKLAKGARGLGKSILGYGRAGLGLANAGLSTLGGLSGGGAVLGAATLGAGAAAGYGLHGTYKAVTEGRSHQNDLARRLGLVKSKEDIENGTDSRSNWNPLKWAGKGIDDTMEVAANASTMFSGGISAKEAKVRDEANAKKLAELRAKNEAKKQATITPPVSTLVEQKGSVKEIETNTSVPAIPVVAKSTVQASVPSVPVIENKGIVKASVGATTPLALPSHNVKSSNEIDWQKEQREAAEDDRSIAERQAEDIKKLNKTTETAYSPSGLFSRLFSNLAGSIKKFFGFGDKGQQPAPAPGQTPSGTTTPGATDTPGGGGSPPMLQAHVSPTMLQSGAPASGFSGGGGAIDKYSGRAYSQNQGDKEKGALDCSSLTTKVYQEAGIKGVSGTAQQQFDQTQKISGGKHIPYKSLQPGDLMFFHDPDVTGGKKGKKGTGRYITHVGLFLGKDPKDGKVKMFHTGSTKRPSGVYPADDPYHQKTFVGGGRGAGGAEDSKKVAAAMLGSGGDPKKTQTELAKLNKDEEKTSSGVPSGANVAATEIKKSEAASAQASSASSSPIVATKTAEDKKETATSVVASQGLTVNNKESIPTASTPTLGQQAVTTPDLASAVPVSSAGSTKTSAIPEANTMVARQQGTSSKASPIASLPGIQRPTNVFNSLLDNAKTFGGSVLDSGREVVGNVSNSIKNTFTSAKRVADTGPIVNRTPLDPVYQDQRSVPAEKAESKGSEGNSQVAQQPRLSTDGIFMMDDAGLNLVILGVV